MIRGQHPIKTMGIGLTDADKKKLFFDEYGSSAKKVFWNTQYGILGVHFEYKSKGEEPIPVNMYFEEDRGTWECECF